MLKKIWFKIYGFVYALFGGMANTENIVFHNSGADAGSTTINKKVSQNRVSEDLLKGELTQEVKELRYRTYKVDRESKNYEYFSPTLALKSETKDDLLKESNNPLFTKDNFKQDSKFVTVENSENLPIITIQDNKRHIETIYESLYQEDKKQIPQYGLKILREFIPNFMIESFVTKIVVKEKNENHCVLDLYVSKYVDPTSIKSKPFISEIKRIMSNESKITDTLKFDTAEFITSHAYKLPDMLRFKFKYIFFDKIVEFDGSYVIKFNATIEENGFDLTNQYYSKEMDEKYKTKAKKNVDINMNGGHTEEEYVCSECGKVIKYSTKNIDGMDVDENSSKTNNTEYLDLQISEQTFGKKLCHDCLNKYLKKLEEEDGE